MLRRLQKERKKKGANPCSYADHRSLKEYERINDGLDTEIRYGSKEMQCVFAGIPLTSFQYD